MNGWIFIVAFASVLSLAPTGVDAVSNALSLKAAQGKSGKKGKSDQNNGKSGGGKNAGGGNAKAGISGNNGSNNSGDSDGQGDAASVFGLLNAGHASANARLHAAPNSIVGLIAAYEKGLGQAAALESEIATLTQELADLEVSLADKEALAANLEAESEIAQQGLADAEADLATLTEDAETAAALAEANPNDATLAEAAADALAAVGAQVEVVGGLSTDAAEAETLAAEALADFEVTAALVEDGDTLLAETTNTLVTAEDEFAALNPEASLIDAANKPVTDEVVEAVNALLEIEDVTAEANAGN